MLGDFLHLGPVDYAARLHSKYADAALMIFNYLGTSKSFGPLQRDVPQQVSRDTYGVTHMHDLWFQFVSDYDPSGLVQTDLQAAQLVTQFTSEFVLYGNIQNRYPHYLSSSPNYVIMQNSYQLVPILAKNGEGYRTGFVDFINDYIYMLQDQAVFFPPYFPKEEYKAYQTATWSLLGVLILLIVIALILCVVVYLRRGSETEDEGVERNKETKVKLRQQNSDYD